MWDKCMNCLVLQRILVYYTSQDYIMLEYVLQKGLTSSTIKHMGYCNKLFKNYPHQEQMISHKTSCYYHIKTEN